MYYIQINVNHVNKKGETALSMAITWSHHEILDLLLQTKGINLNSIDEWGETPLFGVAKSASIESLKLLLKHNVRMFSNTK